MIYYGALNAQDIHAETTRLQNYELVVFGMELMSDTSLLKEVPVTYEKNNSCNTR